MSARPPQRILRFERNDSCSAPRTPFELKCPASAGVAGGCEAPVDCFGRVPRVLRAHSRMIGLCKLRSESTKTGDGEETRADRTRRAEARGSTEPADGQHRQAPRIACAFENTSTPAETFPSRSTPRPSSNAASALCPEPPHHPSFHHRPPPVAASAEHRDTSPADFRTAPASHRRHKEQWAER